MKQMMIAFAILGITFCGAQVEAQVCHSAAKTAKAHKVALAAHRSHTAKSANLYQVCREQGGYYTCCVHKNTTTAKL